MSHTDVCLALIESSETCGREMVRRVHGDVLLLNSKQTLTDDWLEKVDAIALLGADVDMALLKRCLDASKHVLVTASACRSRSMLDALVEQVRASSGSLQLGNPLASLPSRQLIWEQFQQGKLGQAGLIRVHRWGGATTAHQSLENGHSPDLLFEIANLLRFLSRSPQRVFALEYAARRGNVVHLSWADGAMAMIDFVAQLVGCSAYASFSVIGSQGAAYADDHQNVQLLIQNQLAGMTVPEAPHPQMPMLMDFLARVCNSKLSLKRTESCAEREQLSRDSLSTWKQTISIAEAISESLRTQKAVELDYALK